jgi:hypothetical protein
MVGAPHQGSRSLERELSLIKQPGVTIEQATPVLGSGSGSADVAGEHVQRWRWDVLQDPVSGHM